MKLNQDILQKRLPANYLTRSLESEIQEVLDTEEVIIIYGARQVGKSSLLMKLAHQLIKHQPIHYYTLDDYQNPDLDDPNRLIAALQSDFNSKNKVILIIDEAQRLKNIGLFVKNIYDQKLPIKIILTGSASFAIKSKIQEPLTGRKFEFHLSPFSLNEIFNHQGIDPKRVMATNNQMETILANYLLFGGYPQIYFTADIKLKVKRLEEIVDSYIHKDLAELFGITDNNAVRKVTAYLAENIGNLLSIEKITSMGGLKRNEVERIIEALKQTFVTYELFPLSSDKFKEVSKRPKIYFHDTGLRNAFLRKLDENLIVNDLGSLFENVIGSELIDKYGATRVNYWRTINQTEVDFVINNPEQYIGVETKYSWRLERKPQSLLRFQAEYQARGTVLHRGNYWQTHLL